MAIILWIVARCTGGLVWPILVVVDVFWRWSELCWTISPTSESTQNTWRNVFSRECANVAFVADTAIHVSSAHLSHRCINNSSIPGSQILQIALALSGHSETIVSTVLFESHDYEHLISFSSDQSAQTHQHGRSRVSRVLSWPLVPNTSRNAFR